MHIRITLLTAACALALAACGDESSQSPEEAATPPPAPVEPATPAPVAEAPAPAAATPAATPAGDGKPAAVVTNCSTEIEGNDAMQFNVGSITVPASCTEFTITLNHTGQMPVTAMGHNVVITAEADMRAVAAAGVGAGIQDEYLPPDDPRIIANTELVGGGESTSVTFPVSDIQDGGPYVFFCSFPGHAAIMKGTIQAE